jgi:homoserine dehydrogenase
LLAVHGTEIFAAASAKGVMVAFEAAVAGGIPIIKALREGLAANHIECIYGILNGTCNYILTQMSSTGAAYAKALSEAQAKGYAEADPTLDVSGEDTRHKLAILAGLAFGAEVNVSDIYLEGIAGIDPADITYGKQLGYTLKLLAVARIVDGAMSLRVHPTFVPASNSLATVSGVDNAVLVTGHAVGDTFYVGPGAGMMPTGSSIVADIVDAAIGRARITANSVAWLAGRRIALPVQPMQEIRSRYYLRFVVADQPGVLAAVTGALGRNRISVASVLQYESDSPQGVPLVVTTHIAHEGDLAAALDEIRRLPVVSGPAVRIRMLATREESA